MSPDPLLNLPTPWVEVLARKVNARSWEARVAARRNLRLARLSRERWSRDTKSSYDDFMVLVMGSDTY